MTPRSLGLPTDTSHVAGGPVDLPSSHPLGINYRPVNQLGLPTPNSRVGVCGFQNMTSVRFWKKTAVFGSVFGFIKNRGYRFGC